MRQTKMTEAHNGADAPSLGSVREKQQRYDKAMNNAWKAYAEARAKARKERDE